MAPINVFVTGKVSPYLVFAPHALKLIKNFVYGPALFQLLPRAGFKSKLDCGYRPLESGVSVFNSPLGILLICLTDLQRQMLWGLIIPCMTPG